MGDLAKTSLEQGHVAHENEPTMSEEDATKPIMMKKFDVEMKMHSDCRCKQNDWPEEQSNECHLKNT